MLLLQVELLLNRYQLFQQSILCHPTLKAGYAKNRNARAVKAGFKIFMPVPPKTSLPIITAKAVAQQPSKVEYREEVPGE
jgi:hypothetical protein